MDPKIGLLKKEFGAKGMYILDCVLCKVYKENGYYLDWNDDICLLMSDGVDGECKPNLIAEVVKGCIRRSIFDKRVFDSFNVLTSAGVQRRFLRMCNNREQIIMIEEYWVLDMDDKNDVPAGILNKLILKSLKTKQKPNKRTQNDVISNGNPKKEKETKINEITENTLTVIPAEILKEWKSYEEMRKKIRKPMTDDAMKLALNELNKLAPNDFEKQKAILNQSVFKAWQGLYPLKKEANIPKFSGRDDSAYNNLFDDISKIEV